ncbi:MAG: hypothetical protein COA70_10415 [Planctomycetota bacterium]|nr:MAG: hypothetical protein COA70_10415 [Planctomycetota bacterium]
MLSLFTTLLFVSAQSVGGNSDLLHQWDGNVNTGWFGYSVDSAGDVNNDGIPDQIVGNPQAAPGGFTNAGSVTVYSGADGALLYQWNGVSASDFFGHSVAPAGDVNQDGFDDVLVGGYGMDGGGLNGSGSAFLYSGFDGSILFQWNGAVVNEQLGYSVASAGFINLDTIPDIIIGSPQANPGGDLYAGIATIYSGADASQLYQFRGTFPDDKMGNSVSSAGDVNGDGIGDVIVAAREADLFYPFGPTDVGSAFVFSGADGSQLYRWDGNDLGIALQVSGAGDVDGDGFDDIMFNDPYSYTLSLTWMGRVWVYSGATGALLHRFEGTADYDTLGDSINSVGDVNGDGCDDLLIGASGSTNTVGYANLYSGKDGTRLHQFQGHTSLDRFGWSSANAGDVDGDGNTDFLIGAFTADPAGITDAGSVFVYTYLPLLESNTNQIPAAAGATLDLTLDFPDSAATYEYITLMSLGGTGPVFYGTNIPLTVDSYLLDSAAGIYPFNTTANLQGTLDANGDGTASITFAPGAFNFAVGYTFWLAAVAFPSGQLPELSSVVIPVEFIP